MGVESCVDRQMQCTGLEPQPESCNGIDDNCDGSTDPENSAGCTSYYFDGDSDGYGVGAARCLCTPDPVGKFTATSKDDCADGVPEVNPGHPEVCNSIDDNCDGTTDDPGSQGCKTYYYDGDHDEFGTDQSVCLCTADPTSNFTALVRDINSWA